MNIILRRILCKKVYNIKQKIKDYKMRIKAFLSSGRFKIINVVKFGDMINITSEYPRWEYVL